MPTAPTPLYTGKFLQLLRGEGGWEYVTRTKASGVVVVLAITGDEKLLMVEQYRPPIGRRAVELPAGLVGDVTSTESAEDAVRRELLEETGYACRTVRVLAANCPTTSGLTSETVWLYHALELARQTDTPAGDGHEELTLHEVPLADLKSFLDSQSRAGKAIDLKIFAALQLAGITSRGA